MEDKRGTDGVFDEYVNSIEKIKSTAKELSELLDRFHQEPQVVQGQHTGIQVGHEFQDKDHAHMGIPAIDRPLTQNEILSKLAEDVVEMCELLISKAKDKQSPIKVLEDIAYDPLLRINRMLECEKWVTHLAWASEEFKNAILALGGPNSSDSDQAQLRDILKEKLWGKSQPHINIDEHIRMYFHENTDDEIHWVIPKQRTSYPRGY